MLALVMAEPPPDLAACAVITVTADTAATVTMATAVNRRFLTTLSGFHLRIPRSSLSRPEWADQRIVKARSFVDNIVNGLNRASVSQPKIARSRYLGNCLLFLVARRR